MTADIRLLSEHKRRIAAVYNLAANGYDGPALRFFQLAASDLVEMAHLKSGSLVLDAATGTGAAGIVAISKLGPTGRVIGVDIAGDMLTVGRHNLASRRLAHITLQYGDSEHLDFANEHFDAVLCASGIYYLPDMLGALKEWRRVTKPGGTVAFSSFGARAFQPMSDLFEARMRRNGMLIAAPERPFAWQQLSDPERCYELLGAAGFLQVDVCVKQLGYHLNTVEEWWDIIWNCDLRGPVSQLTSEQLTRFKQAHLAEVGPLATDKGLWLDVPAILAVGQKP